MLTKKHDLSDFGDSEHWSKEDLKTLLQAKGNLQEQLFQKARDVRREQGLDNVLLRGVIETSNYCQKKCDYCAMRCIDNKLEKYRLEPKMILSIAEQIKRANIGVAFLQSGQDPHDESILEEVIPKIRELDMSVLLCLGEKRKEVYQKYAKLGANFYILKFETSDSELYERIVHDPLEPRLNCIQWIKEAGLKLGTGNIVGLPGQSLDSLVEDIQLARSLKPDFVSSAPFIPNKGTPLENEPHGDLNLTLNNMALWRILLKNCRIPTVSALEKIQTGGQLMGLNAGANIMTVNFTPKAEQDKFNIYSDKRFVVKLEHAQEVVQSAGLQIHNTQEEND